MAKYTKIAADTFKKLQLNAGVLCTNFEPGTAFWPQRLVVLISRPPRLLPTLARTLIIARRIQWS